MRTGRAATRETANRKRSAMLTTVVHAEGLLVQGLGSTCSRQVVPREPTDSAAFPFPPTSGCPQFDTNRNQL